MSESKQELRECLACRCQKVFSNFNVYNNPLRHIIFCADCPCRMEFFSSTREQAVERWNTRTTDKRVDELEKENAKLRQHAEKLAEAVEDLLSLVKRIPSLNNHKYDGLGIQVNNALTAYRADYPKEGK